MSRGVAWVRSHLGQSAGLALVAVFGLWFACGRSRPAPLPHAEQRTVDSLAMTLPTFQFARSATVRAETVYVRQAIQAARHDTVAGLRADSIGHVADSLQRAAEAQHDTSSSWRVVAVARGEEVDAVRASRDSARVALASEIEARRQADTRAALDSARRVAVEDLNARLQHDLTTAGQCRVAYVISCPSRPVVALVATLVTAGVIEGTRMALTGKP